MTLRSLAGAAMLAGSISLTMSSVQASVWVVAPSGGHYTQIQAAVDAAIDGDTILVKTGTYTAVTINGKALTICADTGASPAISGTLVVKNVAAGTKVVLSGLKATGLTSNQMAETAGVGLHVLNNAGPVRVQSCEFTGANGIGDGTTGGGGGDCCSLNLHHWGWDGARVETNTAGVEFSASTLRGGRGAWANINCYCGTGGPGGDGLRCIASQVALYDCALQGARGGDNGGSGGPGGAGARTVAGSLVCGLFASGSTFTGGRGGDGYDYIWSEGGSGGDGLVVQAATVAQILDNVASGGSGGQACGTLFPPGPDGIGMSGTGTIYPFAVDRLKFTIASIAREATTVPITVQGAPGDRVYLMIARTTGFQPIPSWRGVLLTQNAIPERVMILGEIPLSGTLSATFSVPNLGVSELARTSFMQAFRLDAAGSKTLGSFAVLTVLDASL